MDLLGEEIEFEHDVDGLWGWCAAVVVARPVAAEGARVVRRRQEAVRPITCRGGRAGKGFDPRCLETCKANGVHGGGEEFSVGKWLPARYRLVINQVVTGNNY